MKKVILVTSIFSSLFVQAQIQTPKLSPAASIEQTIGLTEVEIEYSRPAKRSREVFGDLVPYGEIWRTGANENTTIETDGPLLFGVDTLPAGTYALYTKPEKDNWTVYFYASTDNWGTPDNWDEQKVVLQTVIPVVRTKNIVENFTISFDNVTTKTAEITLMWDDIRVSVPFSVDTDKQMMKMINDVMAGPSSNDYYRAADYLLGENIEQERALEYMDKAIALRGEATFWMLRKKSLILANLGQYKDAISVAEESLKLAKEANNQNYVNMNEKSITTWKQK